MTWLLMILKNPLMAFDLVDSKGDPDHGKVMGFLAFWAFVALAIAQRLPSVGHTLIMFSGIYGARTFIAFLKTKSVTATGTDAVTRTIQQVEAARTKYFGTDGAP